MAKYEEVMQILKKQKIWHIDEVYQRVRQAGIYYRTSSIASCLKYLEDHGFIRVKGFRVEVVRDG